MYKCVKCNRLCLVSLFRWLLHDPNMRLRSTYKPYQDAVEKYFTELFKILVPLQVVFNTKSYCFKLTAHRSFHTGKTKLIYAYKYGILTSTFSGLLPPMVVKTHVQLGIYHSIIQILTTDLCYLGCIWRTSHSFSSGK